MGTELNLWSPRWFRSGFSIFSGVHQSIGVKLDLCLSAEPIMAQVVLVKLRHTSLRAWSDDTLRYNWAVLDTRHVVFCSELKQEETCVYSLGTGLDKALSVLVLVSRRMSRFHLLG